MLEIEINYEDLQNQPILNCGMLGSVSDGKSTCVKQTTGVKTQRHSSEQTRNITIKPGYANMKIWSDGEKYYSSDSKPITKEVNGKECKLVHHLSCIDCPGHHELILTMLGSIRLMNCVILVVSAAEPINKKPQLIQHIAAIKISGIKKIIVCLNKLDLVSIDVARERYNELLLLLRKYEISPNAIIPTSFNKSIGIDWLLEEIMNHFKLEEGKSSSTTFMATRSFDVNKPGDSWEDLKGGVIGGSLFDGSLSVNDVIEIRPGIISNKNGKLSSQPIKSKILSFKTDQENLTTIKPGGLIGIGTEIDPYYCKDDFLSGNTLGLEGKLPSVYDEVTLKFKIISDFGGQWKPKENDSVNLQIGSISILSNVKKFGKKDITFTLTRPACIDPESLIMISHKEDGIMKIVASGNLVKGNILVE